MPMSGIERRPFSLPLEQLERWLREEVGPTYDEMKADPASAIPLNDVIKSIRARRVASLD